MSDLGFRESLAMGVGGIIGGGIFAALGVAAAIAGNAAPLSYLLAGIVALASAYSYVKMTAHFEDEGGSFTFLEHYVDNENIAGIVGWILVVGYIGTMAMYAYAFGSFAANIFPMSFSLLRPVLSVAIVAIFVLVNFSGTSSAGESEDLLVYVKVLILGLFSVSGIYMIFQQPERAFFTGGFLQHGVLSPIFAVGAIFVSFEGFQLLTYEYSEMKDGIDTLKKAVYLSVITSSVIYVLVALVTTNLMTAEQIAVHKETALAFASSQIFHNQLFQAASVFLVSLAALFSTASAINATLFGTSRLTYRIASDNEMPELFSFRNSHGVPTHSIAAVGGLTALFTFAGSLEEVTTFASVAFICIFGIVNFICLKDTEARDRAWIPALGLFGSITSLGLLVMHLYRTNHHMLYYIGGIFIAIFIAEFFYFEREEIEEEVEEIEEEAEKEERELEKEVENIESNLEEEFEK
ncbi:amino acid permease [Candidatus Nanohaloarchaea archaeon]|nr:amino acid permease [Candidatus Nanohaloarchaea archaeon]